MILVRQPNGKYLTYSWLKYVNTNLTEEDIKNIYIENAKKQAEIDICNAKGLDCVLKDEFRYGIKLLTDKDLKDMEINISKKELIKKVPLKPTNKKYISCNFETIAQCPNCGANVVNGIGYTQEKCGKCEQMLDWAGDY